MVKYDDLIGVPYVNGGRDPETGLDCWGLAIEMFRRQGLRLPPYLVDATRTELCMSLFESGRPKWVELEDPEPGCIVLIRFIGNPLPSHCGVYVGYGEFIHAEHTAVQVDRVARWGPRIIGYFKPRKGTYPHV